VEVEGVIFLSSLWTGITVSYFKPSIDSPIATAESLREATRNSLETAEELDSESLVLPLIGCGSCECPTHEGKYLICDEIRAYEPMTLEDVRVIAYSDRERDIIRQVVNDQQHPEAVD
jgi:O-acetyl-ADP-ribose deacetylase (regulator of RNase III)